ncbi:unnamed protein product [Peniophora sp. CBMAI 1063]|nr:unnamed protein product [Peniophora sp. CBMAI 1063]
MEPNTASRLRERARNKLKDYLTMAPALKVSHLLAFTLTDKAPSLRIARLSDGPTLSFRVERYSLIKDVLASSRHAKSIGKVEYMSPPLLVLASFPPPGPGVPPHLPLVMKAFQSLFPPLSPHTLTLSSARRVVLISYDPARKTLDWRHYRIAVKPAGVSKRVRKVLDPSTSHTPLDLSNEKDIADFVLRRKGAGTDGYETGTTSDGYASSAAEGEEGNTVRLADDYVGRNNKKGSKRAVRLDEIGPRMELRLVKITEGIPGRPGAVIFHEFIKKSKSETAKQEKEHAEREKLRKQRRAEQEANVARKKAAAKKGKKGDGEDGEVDDEDVSGAEDDDDAMGVYSGDEDEGAVDEEEDWDDEEEVTEGEVSGDEDEDSDSEPEERAPPPKRQKTKGKR